MKPACAHTATSNYSGIDDMASSERDGLYRYDAPGQLPPGAAMPGDATLVMPAATRLARRPVRAAKPTARDHRVTGQPGFVLHSYPYKETSLIVDVLTRDHGRVALVAKGAKRPYSRLRGVLQTFQPLSLTALTSDFSANAASGALEGYV